MDLCKIKFDLPSSGLTPRVQEKSFRACFLTDIHIRFLRLIIIRLGERSRSLLTPDRTRFGERTEGLKASKLVSLARGISSFRGLNSSARNITVLCFDSWGGSTRTTFVFCSSKSLSWSPSIENRNTLELK